MMFSICYAYFSLLVCWCIALMVSKHLHFKKGLKSAHETLLCAVVLKPRLSRMENASLCYQLLNLFVLKIKLPFVRKAAAFIG